MQNLSLKEGIEFWFPEMYNPSKHLIFFCQLKNQQGKSRFCPITGLQESYLRITKNNQRKLDPIKWEIPLTKEFTEFSCTGFLTNAEDYSAILEKKGIQNGIGLGQKKFLELFCFNASPNDSVELFCLKLPELEIEFKYEVIRI